MSMSCFDCHDYMDGYNRGKKEGLIEELEKIKSEMKEEHDNHTCFYVNGNYYCDHWGDLQIIDKHISELKGE